MPGLRRVRRCRSVHRRSARQPAELKPHQRLRTGYQHIPDWFAGRGQREHRRRLAVHRVEILQPGVDAQKHERNRGLELAGLNRLHLAGLMSSPLFGGTAAG